MLQQQCKKKQCKIPKIWNKHNKQESIFLSKFQINQSSHVKYKSYGINTMGKIK